MTLPTIDEMKLTAYALGELDEAERADIEALLRDSAFARGYVQSIRETAARLSEELAGEAASGLTAIQRAALEQRIGQAAGREPAVLRTHRRWNRAVLAGSIAASVLIVGALAVQLLSRLYRQLEPPRDDRQAVAHLPYIINDGAPATPSLPGADHLPMIRPSGQKIDQSEETGNWPGEPGSPLVRNPSVAPEANPFLGAPHLLSPGVPLTTVRLVSGGPPMWAGSAVSIAPSAPPHQAGPKANWFDAYANPPTTSASPDPKDAATPPVDTDAYDRFNDNPFLSAADHPLSSFAPDVGFASYANIRRALARGQLPPADAVRPEELLNYFSWHVPKPAGDSVMSGDIELSVCPWNAQHRLARIALQTREIAAETRPPVNLVFLVDVSSSMAADDRLPIIQRGLRLLLSQLGSRDRLAIVAAPQAEGFLLPPTPGNQHRTILDAIARLRSGGKPAAGTGLETAYYAAASSFIASGINRVVLMTDGQWLAGTRNPDGLTGVIREGAGVGISLGVVAVAPAHLHDAALRHLAATGKGTLSIVDDSTDARKALFNLANGSLIQAAQDMRIAVKINPVAVASYRLIGYESHLLQSNGAQEQNDGEVGAGHAVTALYELAPAPGADGSPLAVHVRCKRPGSEAEESLDLTAPLQSTPLSKASNDFYFASSVAEFALLLRLSNDAGNASFASALDLAQRGRGTDEDGSRAEFTALLRRRAPSHRSRAGFIPPLLAITRCLRVQGVRVQGSGNHGDHEIRFG